MSTQKATPPCSSAAVHIHVHALPLPVQAWLMQSELHGSCWRGSWSGGMVPAPRQRQHVAACGSAAALSGDAHPAGPHFFHFIAIMHVGTL